MSQAAKATFSKLIDFEKSTFWVLAGVLSVGCCISAVNRLIKCQEERLDIMRQRNAEAAEFKTLQQQAEAASNKVTCLEHDLLQAKGWRWHPVQQRLQHCLHEDRQ
eukprot:jgi/Chrzof1/12905/Cz07g11220.t1